MKYVQAVEVLRNTIVSLKTIQRNHATLYGNRTGFFLGDAIDVLGEQADKLLLVMQVEKMVTIEFVFLNKGDEDAVTLYSLADAASPVLNSEIIQLSSTTESALLEYTNQKERDE